MRAIGENRGASLTICARTIFFNFTRILDIPIAIVLANKISVPFISINYYLLFLCYIKNIISKVIKYPLLHPWVLIPLDG